MIGVIILLPETRNYSFNDKQSDDDTSQTDEVDKTSIGMSISAVEVH
jgi:hypothetical protein